MNQNHIRNLKRCLTASLLPIPVLASLQGLSSFIKANISKQLNDITIFLNAFMQANLLVYILLAFYLYSLMRYMTGKKQSLKPVAKFFNGLYSFVLSLCINYGALTRNNQVDAYLHSSIGLIVLLVKTIALTVVIYLTINSLVIKIQGLNFAKLMTEREDQTKVSYLRWFLIILICWLPYIFILYPGTTNADTNNQFMEFFGHGNQVRDIYPIGWYLVGKHPFTISNQHNFLVTLFYGSNLKIGVQLFHNAGIGIFLSSFAQIIFLVGLYTYSLGLFKRLGMSDKLIKIFGWFYALFPMSPIITQFLTKNVLYSEFLLWMILLLAGFIKDFHLSKKWLLAFSLSVLGQLATEKYGLYIVAFMLVVGLICAKWQKQVLKVVLCAFCMTVLFVGGQKIVFSSLHVPDGDPIEGQALMLQSTALYQKEYGNTLSAKDNKIINRVFVQKNLVQLYLPYRDDFVKSSGAKVKGFKTGYRYKTVTKADIQAYKHLWPKLMMKHPMVLFEATMSQGYGYLDVLSLQSPTTAQTASDSLNLSAPLVDIPNGKETIHIDYLNRQLPLKKLLAGLFDTFSKLVPFSILLNGNAVLCLTILAFLLLIAEGLYKESLLILPALLQVPIIMMSPVNNNQRYMYTFFLMLAVVLGLTTVWIMRHHQSKKLDITMREDKIGKEEE